MPSAAAPAETATNAVIGGPIAQLLEQNFAILNEASTERRCSQPPCCCTVCAQSQPCPD